MAEAALSEAPLKRKLEGASEATECKKPRDCVSQDKPPLLTDAKTSEIERGLLKHVRNGDLKASEGVSGSTSAAFEVPEPLGEGEVLEEALEQDDGDERGDEAPENEEISEIDTENDSEDEDESDGSESDEEEDDEDDEEEMPASTSSSLQAEAMHKGKGKEKMGDEKGKGIMAVDKGKGKAIAEDEAAPGSDEDDAGYLSEDPLEEVDLNNILPSRTRRRSTSMHYDFVDQGDEEEDDDDDDSDA